MILAMAGFAFEDLFIKMLFNTNLKELYSTEYTLMRRFKFTFNAIEQCTPAELNVYYEIIHKDLGPLTGNDLLTIGLVTEALIFALSAFDTPEEDPDWALVYPELVGGPGTADKKESTTSALLAKVTNIFSKKADKETEKKGELDTTSSDTDDDEKRDRGRSRHVRDDNRAIAKPPSAPLKEKLKTKCCG